MPARSGRLLRSPLLLRLLMERRGDTCRALAARIGLSHQMVAHLAYARRDTCTTRTAELVAGGLDVRTDELFWPVESDDSSEN